MPTRPTRPPTLRTAVAAVLLAVLAAGCSGLPESGDKGYTTGEGVVTQVAVDERDDPVDLVADDLEGDEIDLAELRGKPTVVVVWGAWCVECRADQPEVNEAVAELGERANFVGLNVREKSVDDALAYVRAEELSYPSLDANDGSELSAFTGELTPYTVPAFVVLDTEGRPAATIIGRLPSSLTLVELVEEVAGDRQGRRARDGGAAGRLGDG